LLLPNPARDRVRIQRANAQGAATLDVLDASGRLLRQLPFPSGVLQLELNDLPTGVLLLAVTDEQGRRVARVVVER
ncbi:MAG: T9SS type A sorting domain-containing protein, partial [Flavobacteriales bacterium]|nr:T9SS type A sorting domain-containing protein [Flavobacteriales bacterium]MCB0813306.1 T9SS type A sorting domain-containing protein [Flavobacteriales bacterium]